MLQFDYESILSELKLNLSKKLGGTITGGSAANRLLEVIAEELSQISRYAEYLTRESKWSLAQNSSSILTQLELFGYNPHRKVGASGTLRISTDSGFASSYPYKITIPKFSRFSNGQYTFCTTEEVSLINTVPYVDVPIVQGNLNTKTFSGAALNNFRYQILEDSVENNLYELTLNSIKMVEVNSFGDTQITYNGISSETGIDSAQYEYKIRNIQGFSGIEILFPTGSTYTEVHQFLFKYLITEGISGNVSSLNSITTPLDTFVDSRGVSVTLYCTNPEPVTGGDTYETIDDMRDNAPLSFNRVNKIITKNDYSSEIQRIMSGKGIFYLWTEEEANNQTSQFLEAYDYFDNSKIFLCGCSYDPETRILTPWDRSVLNRLNSDSRLSLQKSFTDYFDLKEPRIIYFYITGEVFFDGRLINETQTKTAVDEKLIKTYSQLNTSFYKNIYHSNYIATLEEIPEVKHVDVRINLYLFVPFYLEDTSGKITTDIVDSFSFSASEENRYYISTVGGPDRLLIKDLFYFEYDKSTQNYKFFNVDGSENTNVTWEDPSKTPRVGVLGKMILDAEKYKADLEGNSMVVRFVPFNDDAVLMEQNQVLTLTSSTNLSCVWKDPSTYTTENSLVFTEVR